MRPIYAAIPVIAMCAVAGAMVMADDGENDPVLEYYIIDTLGPLDEGEYLVDCHIYFVDPPAYAIHVRFYLDDGTCIVDNDIVSGQFSTAYRLTPEDWMKEGEVVPYEYNQVKFSVDGYRLVRVSAPSGTP